MWLARFALIWFLLCLLAFGSLTLAINGEPSSLWMWREVFGIDLHVPGHNAVEVMR